jgi:hypothetical protein
MHVHKFLAAALGCGGAALALHLCATSVPTVEAGTAVRLELEQLARHAELIVEGRVIATRAFRDTRGEVRTEVTLSVDETFAGEPFATRRFELPGGVLADGSGTLIAGMPSVALGEDALLFLTEESASGLRMPVGLAQGKFRLVRDDQGRLGLLRDAAELTLLDPRTGAGAPAPIPAVLDHAQVVARIRTARGTSEGQVR